MPTFRKVHLIMKYAGVALKWTLPLALPLLWLYWILPFWGVPFNASRHGPPPVTPAWALECWLWEDDANNAQAVLELLEGYEKHDIPVRTVILDSPWSMRYNDFKVDEARYPEPERFFTGLQDRGYRVVLWMTCMVNSRNRDTAIRESEDFWMEARAKGYLAGNGKQMRWWKGRGGFIDYTNPEAMAWWRGMQQPLFDWGIDGWKLDGTDSMFGGFFGPIPHPFLRTQSGLMTTRRYMDHYARDEYKHGLSRNPEFATLIRSMDRYAHPEGFAPIDAAPVTWVGDQNHTWSLREGGLEEAIADVLRSAKKGYCVTGSDIGGFGGGSVIPPEVYIRWSQFSAFCGLFMNGGHGDRALWRRTEDELRIIRKFSWLHTELVPYIYSHVVECSRGGKPLMRPMKGKRQYLFGDDFLVAPIFTPGGMREVKLPEGRWRYLFDETKVFDGPATLPEKAYPLDEAPAYIREGAIIPMRVSRDYTGFGDKNSEGLLTLALYPAAEPSAFTIHHADKEGDTLVSMSQESGRLSITLAGTPIRHILRILAPAKPAEVTREGRVLTEGTEWRYDPTRGLLWVTCGEGKGVNAPLRPGARYAVYRIRG